MGVAQSMTVESPVGLLTVVATGGGLVRVAFGGPDSVTQYATAAVKAAGDGDPAPHLAATRDQLAEYFAGKRTGFELSVDPVVSSQYYREGFQAAARAAMNDIAYGETRSYGQLAAECGNPKASRAVGTACATNPLPIIVPCHRVTRADGSVGAYLGGSCAKEFLLKLEAGGNRNAVFAV